jgi:hypothetical protein
LENVLTKALRIQTANQTAEGGAIVNMQTE